MAAESAAGGKLTIAYDRPGAALRKQAALCCCCGSGQSNAESNAVAAPAERRPAVQ
ncbi:MAG: hypothetical protein J6Y20_14725 [Lachnospiraceae bacterium]|nr:hypothetical protein [Lachnospiraceae bacterium]